MRRAHLTRGIASFPERGCLYLSCHPTLNVSDGPFAPSSLTSKSSLQLVRGVPASLLLHGLSDFVAAWQLLPNVSHCVLKGCVLARCLCYGRLVLSAHIHKTLKVWTWIHTRDHRSFWVDPVFLLNNCLCQCFIALMGRHLPSVWWRCH